jgi:hypothetical protein
MKTAFATALAGLVKALVAPAIDPAATLPVAAAGVLLTMLQRRTAWRSLWG